VRGQPLAVCGPSCAAEPTAAAQGWAVQGGKTSAVGDSRRRFAQRGHGNVPGRCCCANWTRGPRGCQAQRGARPVAKEARSRVPESARPAVAEAQHRLEKTLIKLNDRAKSWAQGGFSSQTTLATAEATLPPPAPLSARQGGVERRPCGIDAADGRCRQAPKPRLTALTLTAPSKGLLGK